MFPPLYILLLLLAQFPDRFGDLSHDAKHRVVISPSHIHEPLQAPTPWPGQASFFSVYTGPNPVDNEDSTTIRCKTAHPLNNLDSRIIIEGVLQDDVVSSSGNILIAAGSKVVGQGYCDPQEGRIRARGRWTFYASDHQISSDGVVMDSTGIEGLKGEETQIGISEEKIKQAIYRDGIYLYLPEGTAFTLQLRGNVSIQDLGSATDR